MKKNFKSMGAVAQAVKILKDVDCRILEEMVQIDSTILFDFKEIEQKLTSFIEPTTLAPKSETVCTVTKTEYDETKEEAPKPVEEPISKITESPVYETGEMTYHKIPQCFLEGTAAKYTNAYIGDDGFVYLKEDSGYTKVMHREYSGACHRLQARLGRKWVLVKPIAVYAFLGVKPKTNVYVYHRDRNLANCSKDNLTLSCIGTTTTHSRKSFREIESVCEIIQKLLPNADTLELSSEIARKCFERKLDVSSGTLYAILNGEYADISSKYFELSAVQVANSKQIEKDVDKDREEQQPETAPAVPTVTESEPEQSPYIEKAEGDAPDYIASHPGCYDDDVIIDILDRKNASKILTDRDVMFLIAYAVSNTRTWQIFANRKYLKTKLGISTACLSPSPFGKLVKITKTASLYGEMLRHRFGIEDLA